MTIAQPLPSPAKFVPVTGLELGPMQTAADAEAFRLLNEEWIMRWFMLEAKDRETLSDPHGMVIARGGTVLMARMDGVAVGCVALLPFGEGAYELSKMAVKPELRGAGLGRKLILYAIEQARLLSATRLFLGSSKRLVNAVHLYETVGFRHVPPESLPSMQYSRADVFMEIAL